MPSFQRNTWKPSVLPMAVSCHVRNFSCQTPYTMEDTSWFLSFPLTAMEGDRDWCRRCDFLSLSSFSPNQVRSTFALSLPSLTPISDRETASFFLPSSRIVSKHTFAQRESALNIDKPSQTAWRCVEHYDLCCYVNHWVGCKTTMIVLSKWGLNIILCNPNRV